MTPDYAPLVTSPVVGLGPVGYTLDFTGVGSHQERCIVHATLAKYDMKNMQNTHRKGGVWISVVTVSATVKDLRRTFTSQH